SRVDELEEAMAAMALEFRGELAQLGVRVDVLEARVDRIEAQVDEQGRRLDDILRRLGSMSLSGKNETTFELTAIDAPGDKFYLDPRDEDSEELKRGSEFKNVFTVTFTAEPAENVNVTASLKATTQLGEVDIEDAEGIKDGTEGIKDGTEGIKAGTEVVGNLLVTTPGVLRSLQVGDLDRDQVAAPFSKYVLYAKKFDDPDEDGDEKRGAHVDLVWGVDDSTNLHGFVSRTGVA